MVKVCSDILIVTEFLIIVALVSAGSSDGFFQFDVTDGVHTVKAQLMPVKVMDLHLSLEPYTPPLQVFPAAALPQCVAVVQLNATTNNPLHSRPIVFSVERPPRRGRLGTSLPGAVLGKILGGLAPIIWEATTAKRNYYRTDYINQ